MKNKMRLKWILVITMMLSFITACAREVKPNPDIKDEATKMSEVTDKELSSETTINTNLWDLVYDENDGWVYEENDLYDDETFSNIMMTIPDGDDTLIYLEIYVAIEEPYTFREYLTSFGFDQYEYAVNDAYELTNVGGIDCLKNEGEYWGSERLRYLNRVEGANATVLIEVTGDCHDERVDKLLSGLTIKLEDIGNEDGPWYWEGEPFKAEAHSVTVGSYTINSEWIAINDFIMTDETFNHDIAGINDEVFLLVDGVLKRYDFDGKSLNFVEDVALTYAYEKIDADVNGNIWLSNFGGPLTQLQDATEKASFEGTNYVAMDPTGAWGISYFTGPDCEKITITNEALEIKPIVFSDVDLINRVFVDNDHIYICGSDVDGSGHKVFIYDTEGNLQMKLADEDGSSLGSISFFTATDNGYVALDGNMREVVLWDKNGTHIGAIADSDIFGTSYPWFCNGTRLQDGSIIVILTEERPDKSAMELVAFKLTGF